jgi:hypothetical protein
MTLGSVATLASARGDRETVIHTRATSDQMLVLQIIMDILSEKVMSASIHSFIHSFSQSVSQSVGQSVSRSVSHWCVRILLPVLKRQTETLSDQALMRADTMTRHTTGTNERE